MTGDVIVSGNVHFGPIYRGIPMPLPRKFTMNNVCHFDGQYSRGQKKVPVPFPFYGRTTV